MTFLASCVVSALCATSATFLPVDDQSSSSAPQSSSSSSSRNGGAQPHHFALGATFGLGTKGAGATVRYFFAKRLGVDTRIFLASRPNDTGTSQGFSIQVAPSLILMLTKPNASADIDIRPYVGFGLALTHVRPDEVLGTPSASGVGEDVYGGIEMQFRQADSFAVSLQVDYFHQPTVLQMTTAPSGTIVLVEAHLYR